MWRFIACLISSTLLLYFASSYDDPVEILVKSILEAKTAQCWTLDRSNNDCVVSSASTGLGFYSYAVAAERGYITKRTASKWIRTGFDSMVSHSPKGGWLYHFVDTSGTAVYSKEVSSIDSLIFYLGAYRAAEKLEDDELLKHIRGKIKKIDLELMYDGRLFRHSLVDRKPSHYWDRYNEGVILYYFFKIPFHFEEPDYTLPLFVFYYPVVFYPNQEVWRYHLEKAIDFQLKTTGRLGFTACDAFGQYRINSPYVISPLSVLICKHIFPNKNIRETASTLQSTSLDGSWKSNTKVFLDEGIALMELTRKKGG